MSFYTIPTQLGLNELAAANVAQQSVLFTHIAIGDGNGNTVTPNINQVNLIHEIYRAGISNISVHPDHANWFIFEAIVPEEVGGWTIREIGLIGGIGPVKLLAVGNYPETEKPLVADGAGRALIIRMVCAFSESAQVQLSVDPMAYASISFVLTQIANHEANLDPHPQYLTRAEADAFYDSIGLAAQAIDIDAARLSTHVEHADPHPQYVTLTEANALFISARAKRFYHSNF